ncbi:single-stranded DNA-binding protein [soil metagenome]
MTNETIVTLQGNVGGDVELRRAGDSVVANIRVAVTPRRYVRRDDEWVDGDTQWYTVNAWRNLGEHCARSLRRGDPVVVHGRLQARTYVNKAGIEVTTFEVEALVVGHDLSRGISSFSRRPSTAGAPAAPEAGAAAAA